MFSCRPSLLFYYENDSIVWCAGGFGSHDWAVVLRGHLGMLQFRELLRGGNVQQLRDQQKSVLCQSRRRVHSVRDQKVRAEKELSQQAAPGRL